MMKSGPKFYHCNKGDVVRLKGGKDTWIVQTYSACESDGHRYVTLTHNLTGVVIEVNSKKLGPSRTRKMSA